MILLPTPSVERKILGLKSRLLFSICLLLESTAISHSSTRVTVKMVIDFHRALHSVAMHRFTSRIQPFVANETRLSLTCLRQSGLVLREHNRHATALSRKEIGPASHSWRWQLQQFSSAGSLNLFLFVAPAAVRLTAFAM